MTEPVQRYVAADGRWSANRVARWGREVEKLLDFDHRGPARWWVHQITQSPTNVAGLYPGRGRSLETVDQLFRLGYLMESTAFEGDYVLAFPLAGDARLEWSEPAGRA